MHDVIIAGCGLGGGYLNKLLSDGIDVKVIEKSRRIVPRDSGIVSIRFNALLEGAENFIGHEIYRMKISSAAKSFMLRSDSAFAYILKREKLLKFLRKEKNICYETIDNIIYSNDRVIVETNKSVHEAKIIIGCDGAASTARRHAGIESPSLYTGMLSRTSEIEYDEINVFLNKLFSPDFFSWAIPQNKEFGLVTGISPRERMEYFRKTMSLKKGRIYAYPIPMGVTKSYSNRVLLLGDACGQTKPTTCGGIIFSMLAARHAAATINESLEKGAFNEKFLSRYEKKWMHEFGNEIKKQMLFRKAYRNMSNKDIDRLFGAFGKHIERLKNFDYDKLSTSLWRMPKIKMAMFALRNAKSFF